MGSARVSVADRCVVEFLVDRSSSDLEEALDPCHQGVGITDEAAPQFEFDVHGGASGTVIRLAALAAESCIELDHGENLSGLDRVVNWITPIAVAIDAYPWNLE